MYVESDIARLYWSLGHWVANNSQTAALHCPNLHKPAYDFTNPAMRDHWVARVTDAVATGYVDGAFIDGDRNGFWSSMVGSCDADKQKAYAVGLNQTVAALATSLMKTRGQKLQAKPL